MPWNNFLVVWAAALPPPTCFPHTVLWLSPRGGLNHSHLFQLGTYIIPVFCLGFYTFTSEFPTVSDSEQLCAVSRPKWWHSSSWAAAPAASSECKLNSNREWEERVWTDLVQDILTPRLREPFPKCSCMLPISGKMCFTLLQAVASQNLNLVGKPPSVPISCSGRAS